MHVFEPRYRDLVRDAMAGERLIAIASFEPGYEANYEGRPAVRPIIGVGAVVGHEPLGDGRATSCCAGWRARASTRAAAPSSYRLVDAATSPIAPRRLRRRRGARHPDPVRRSARAQAASGGETLRELARSQPDLGALVDVLSAALVTDPDDRQTLLETLDVGARVDRVSGEIATVLTRLSSSDGPSN